MAEITDPTVIGFCNEKLRPAADAFVQSYWRFKALWAEFIARGGSSFFNTNGDVIIDGAQDDHRPVITDTKAQVAMNHMNAFVAACEANGSMALNQVMEVAVNMLPR